MAKKKESSALDRLAGKQVVFSGKFGYGVEEMLKAMAEAQQAKVLDDLTDKIDYLVLADLNAGKTVQKKAMTLNGKGATIQVMDSAAFRDFVMPTQDELLALLKDGKCGAEALAAALPIGQRGGHGTAPEARVSWACGLTAWICPDLILPAWRSRTAVSSARSWMPRALARPSVAISAKRPESRLYLVR